MADVLVVVVVSLLLSPGSLVHPGVEGLLGRFPQEKPVMIKI